MFNGMEEPDFSVDDLYSETFSQETTEADTTAASDALEATLWKHIRDFIVIGSEPVPGQVWRSGAWAPANEILKTLQTLNTELKKTIIMVTHDPAAAKFAREELHLDKGRFVSKTAEPA